MNFKPSEVGGWHWAHSPACPLCGQVWPDDSRQLLLHRSPGNRPWHSGERQGSCLTSGGGRWTCWAWTVSSHPFPAAHCPERWTSVPGRRGPGWESLCHLRIGRNERGSGQGLGHRGVHRCDSRGEHPRHAESSCLPHLAPSPFQSHSHSHPSLLSPPRQSLQGGFPGQHAPPAFKEPVIFRGQCLLMLSRETDFCGYRSPYPTAGLDYYSGEIRNVCE